MTTQCGTVKLFCPCSEPLSDTKSPKPAEGTALELPKSLQDPYTLHPLPCLNFCEDCNQIKCRKCIEPEIILKFCPKCMMEMKSDYNYCSKNCLDCPVCGSSTKISAPSSSSSTASSSSEKNVHTEGNYLIKCLSCIYAYRLPLDHRNPRMSVSRLLTQRIDGNSKDSKIFSNLQKFYIESTAKDNKALELERTINKNVKLGSFITTNTVIQEDIDEEEPSSQMKDTEDIYPKRTPLITKCSKICKACRKTIMKPEEVSTSTRFYKLANAIDYLPSIKIFQSDKTDSLLWLLSSNLQTSTEITLTSFNDTLFFPVSKFTVKEKSQDKSFKAFVRQLSITELTPSTKTSRIELMNRQPIDYTDDTKILEQGDGFTLIPVKIDRESDDNEKVTEFTVFVSIKINERKFGYFMKVNLDK